MNANTNTPSTASAETAPRKEAAGITKRSSAFFADPDTLCDGEAQVRYDYGDLEELAAQIEAQGILQPIRVKRLAKDDPRAATGKVFEQLGGHRRKAAVDLLAKKHGGWRNVPHLADGVPILIDDGKMDSQQAIIRMFMDNSGKPLLPLEEAEAYKRLQDGEAEAGVKGMTIKQICKAVGRKEMHVTEILALLDADDEVKEAVKKGEIGKTQAKQIAKHAKGDKDAQKKLVATAKQAQKGDKAAKKTLDKGLDAARRAKAAKKGKELKIRALSDEELAQLGMSVGMRMKELLKNAGKPEDFDLMAWVKADDKLALAASFGALQALKSAAGMTKDVGGAKITLEF